MRSGRGPWHRLPLKSRIDAIRDSLDVGVCQHKNDGVVLFGAVIRKESLSGADPVERAFEEISNRFDLFLRRLYLRHNDRQRGLILFDKSSVESRIQSLARTFKYSGHRWGSSRNYADVPVFLDSRASRLIQLADLVAFALFRFYEKGDNAFYDVIKHCFDAEGGVEHGLFIHV
jgi:hypothetical protein